jgi:hypothetical protein
MGPKKFDSNNDQKLSKKEYYIMLRTDGKDLNEKHIKCFVIKNNNLKKNFKILIKYLFY